MIRLGELMMVLELHRQGLSITAIARRTGRAPKTIRKDIEHGIEAPASGPRCVGRPSKLTPYLDFLSERVTAFPDLSAARLTREIRELGYSGAYTAVKRSLAAIRPEGQPKPYEVCFETPPGVQAQVDFARFVVEFADDPGTSRIVGLFSLVLGHSRFLFARYVLHQDLQTLQRCHRQAFDALGGVPIGIAGNIETLQPCGSPRAPRWPADNPAIIGIVGNSMRCHSMGTWTLVPSGRPSPAAACACCSRT
jgi:transposase